MYKRVYTHTRIKHDRQDPPISISSLHEIWKIQPQTSSFIKRMFGVEFP